MTDSETICPICDTPLEGEDVSYSYLMDSLVHTECLIDSGETD